MNALHRSLGAGFLLLTLLFAGQAEAQSLKETTGTALRVAESHSALADAPRSLDRLYRPLRYAAQVNLPFSSLGGPTIYTDRMACEAAITTLSSEDFESAVLGQTDAGGLFFDVTGAPASEFSDTAVFGLGSIAEGLFVTSTGAFQGLGEALFVAGAGVFGLPNTSTAIAANFFADATRVQFAPGASTACMTYSGEAGESVAIQVFDETGTLIASEARTYTGENEFFGVGGATISEISFTDSDGATALVDDIAFELTGPAPDMAPEPTFFSESFSGDTTGDPLWQRPFNAGDGTSGSCGLSGTGSSVTYETQMFTTTEEGIYIIESDVSSTPVFDTVTLVYEGAFDPADQCLNLVGYQDVNSGGEGERLFAALSGGTDHIIVITGFSTAAGDDFGPYDVDVFGPEPSTSTEISIEDARQGGTGQEVTITGTVTRSMNDFTYIQDGTAGITIRQTSGDFFDDVADGTIAPGSEVTITGTTSEFRGLFQINNDDLTSYFIVGDGDVPEAQTITLAELMANGEDYEAELVEVEGLMTDAMGDFESSTNYDVTDASGAGTLRVPNADDSMIDGTAIPSAGFTFTGVVGQFTFSDPATDGYQLLAIAAEDILADFGLGTFPVPARVSGDTSDDPTYARVDIFADPCATSSTGNGVKYEVIPFTVDTAGDYTITTNYLIAGFDGFLFLYEGAFNPDDPCANLIAASDDFNDTSDSQIADESLMTETQYFIVVTGFSATSDTPDEGEYDGLIEGPAGASVTFNEGMTGGGETCEDLAMDLFAYDGYAVDSEGGFVRMFMEITNDSDEDCDVQVWGMSMDALLTNGVFIRPRRSITVPANSILRQGYNQRVPGEIADGDYEYTVSMGVYDDDAPMDSDIYASQMRTISKGAPTLGFNELSYEYIKATYGHDEAEFKAAFLAALPHTTVLKPKDWGTVEHGTPQISPIGVISEELPMETFVVTVGTTVGPNPFRDATTFQFDVPEEAAVSLQVFDVLGRLVATPAEGTFPGGRHSAVFSGRDLQAGTYVYRLQIGSTVETGRVTLAR